MTSIGTFGKKYATVDLDFEFFEMTVRVNPSCSQAALVEFLAQAGDIDEADEIRGARVIMSMMREVVHPDDFARFWEIAKRERQDPAGDLIPLAHSVIEAVSDFPTGRPSGSPDGDSATPPRSVTVVDLPVSDQRIGPRLSPATLAAIHIQGPRPDLNLALPEVARNGAVPG